MRGLRARSRGQEVRAGTWTPAPSEVAKESDDAIFAVGEREEEWAKDMIATRVLSSHYYPSTFRPVEKMRGSSRFLFVVQFGFQTVERFQETFERFFRAKLRALFASVAVEERREDEFNRMMMIRGETRVVVVVVVAT